MSYATPRSVSMTTLALLLTASAVVSAEGASDEWPQYRGPLADGASTVAGVFEGSVEVGLTVAWKKKLGSAYSGIAVSGGRVVTMFSDGESDVLIALDESTGEELWRFDFEPTNVGRDGSSDGPLSTPMISGNRVVGLGAGGRLFAVDATTGELAWSTDLVEDHGASPPHFGFTTSPVLAAGSAVIQLGAEDAAIAAFDIQSGEKRWATGSDTMMYQTASLMPRGDDVLLVAAGQSKLFGIDPSSGEMLFEYAHEGSGGGYGAPSLTPVPVGKNMLLLKHQDHASAVVRVQDQDGELAVDKVWESRAIRNSYDVPVYHGGNIYAYSARFLTCVDAETGEVRWRSREPGDGSLVLVDGSLVIATKQGTVHVVRASPDGYQEVAGHEVFDDAVWAAPSFANGNVFMRSMEEIARVDIGQGRSVLLAGKEAEEDISGTAFAAFLDKVAATEEKEAVVDAFMESVESFPVIEGKDRVHFVYRGEAGDVAVAGEMIGASLERPMTPVEGTDLFYYSTRLDPNARINYRFIRDYEEILDPLNPRVTETTVYGADMELSFTGEAMELSWVSMPEWQPPVFLEQPEDARRGSMKTLELESEALESKAELAVYLPAGYDDSEERYPVVYVHDGENAQKRGQWATALDNLIGETIQPVIAVFIPPLQVAPPQYAGMFGDLVTMVDETFRTVPEPEARANVGAGLMGAWALFCTISKPGVVGKVGTQSAFLFEFAWDPIKPMVKTPKEQPLQIYMEWGKYDLRNSHEDWAVARTNREAIAYLEERGYEPIAVEGSEGSGWSSWLNGTDDLLAALFPLSDD